MGELVPFARLIAMRRQIEGVNHLSLAWDRMHDHARHGGPEYDSAKAEFWRLNNGEGK